MCRISRVRLMLFSMILMSLSFGGNILTVQDLLKIANNNNLQIQIAKGKLQVAEAQSKQAWSTVYPKINVSAGLNRIDSYQSRALMSAFSSLGPMFTNVNSMSDYYSTKISMSQILYNGSIQPAITASDYGLKSAQAGVQFAKEDVYSNLLTKAFSLIAFQRNLDVMMESKKQMQLLMKKVTALQNNGLATQIDVLRTRASLSRLDISIINLNNEVANLYQNISLLLNRDMGAPTLSSAIIEQFVSDVSIPKKIDSKGSFTNRSDYQQLLAVQSLTETNVKIQEGNFFPNVVFAGSYGYTGTSGFCLNDANRDWSVGVNGSWNIFDFDLTQAKVDEAKANASNMQRQIEQSAKVMENELRLIQLNAQSAKEKIESFKDEINMNEDAFKLMSSRYSLGEVTNLELIEAHNQLLTSRKNLVEAKIEYATQVVKWLKATGQLVAYFEVSRFSSASMSSNTMPSSQ